MIEGTLNWVSRDQRFDVNVKNALPRQWKKWAGYSGTSVFCGGLPVGVIRTVDGNWNGGVLEATPIESLLDDADFCQYLDGAGVPPPLRQTVSRLALTVLDRIAARIYRIDRGEQVERIMARIQQLPSNTPPQIFVIPGLDEDEHHHLIRRLSREPAIQRRLGRNAASEDVIVSLPWPSERTLDPEMRFRDTLLDRLCNVVRLPPPPLGHELDLSVLRRQFDDGVTPRGFWVLIKKAEACAGHGGLLRRWLNLWQNLAALGPGEPVLLFLCLAWDDPPPPRSSVLPDWLRSVPPLPDPEVAAILKAAIEGGQLLTVSELEEIAVRHLHPWIDELHQTCRPVAPEQFEGLRNGLLGRIGTGKRLRGVAADVDSLLERPDVSAGPATLP